MSMTPLAPRLLPRANRSIPPIVWELPVWPDSIAIPLLAPLFSAGATWFLVRQQIPQSELADLAAALEALGEVPNLIIAVEADALQPRRSRVVQQRLTPFARSRCQAVMVVGASPGAIKAGSPFHRLSQLRDEGLMDLFFVDAPDHETAEWMLHHTPAHAVQLRFGLADATAKYRLLEDARGFGTGVLARPPRQAIWRSDRPIDASINLSFTLAEPAITAAVLRLPSTLEELGMLLDAARRPMSPDDAQGWWARFTQQVAPPPPLPRATPPE